MNYIMTITSKGEEYINRYCNCEMVEVFGQDGWDRLRAGEIITDKHGNSTIDMKAAAQIAMKNPTDFRKFSNK